MGECLQWLHSWKRRYPASDARVLGVVFHSDGQPVLGHSLSVQGSVHLHHTRLSTDAQIKTFAWIAVEESRLTPANQGATFPPRLLLCR